MINALARSRDEPGRRFGRPRSVDAHRDDRMRRFREPAGAAGRERLPTQGTAGGVWGYAGRNIHFGIREHAMAAVVTGMALHGGVRPFGATFLSFSDYMRPSIRLAALSKAHVIYVWTHDSIALGEDGPTHQPVEQLASLRAMPNLLVCGRRRHRDRRGVAGRAAAHGRPGRARAHAAEAACARPHGARAGLRTRAGRVRARGRRRWRAGGDPDRDRLGGLARARRAPAARRRGHPQPRRVDALLGTVRRAAAVVPRRGASAGVRARVSIEAASPFGWERYVGPERRDHRRRPLRRVGAGPVVMREFGFTPEHVVETAKSRS